MTWKATRRVMCFVQADINPDNLQRRLVWADTNSKQSEYKKLQISWCCLLRFDAVVWGIFSACEVETLAKLHRRLVSVLSGICSVPDRVTRYRRAVGPQQDAASHKPLLVSFFIFLTEVWSLLINIFAVTQTDPSKKETQWTQICSFHHQNTKRSVFASLWNASETITIPSGAASNLM